MILSVPALAASSRKRCAVSSISKRSTRNSVVRAMRDSIETSMISAMKNPAILRPDGIKIAGFFIALIMLVSMLSRIARTTELRVDRFEIDETAQRFLDEAARAGTLRIITNHPEGSNPEEYRREMAEHRADHNLPGDDPILFLEVEVCDPSEFADVIKVEGMNVGGYHVLRAESSAVPNAIAAFLLHVRDQTGKIPNRYFPWAPRT